MAFKNYILSLIIFINSSVCLSQNSKLDSLVNSLNSVNIPKDKVSTLLSIANELYYSNPDSSNYYVSLAKDLSITHKLTLEYAQSLHAESRYILLKGDIKKTLENLNAAISIFEKEKYLVGLAKCYSLKSIAVGRLSQHEEQRDLLIKAEKIYLNLNDKKGLTNIYINLSNAYRDLKKYDSALFVLRKISDLNLKLTNSLFHINISYGSIYFEQRNIPLAITHLQKSIEVAHQYKMIDSEITGLTRLAECYLTQNNLPEAAKYYQEALVLAQSNKLLVEEADALQGIVALYEKQGNFVSAFNSLKQLKTIEDSILNIEKIKSINEIENKLKLSEKEKVIAKQNLAIETGKVEAANYKNNLLIVISILCLAVLGFISLVFYNRKTNRLYSLIQLQKKEVEKQKEIIEIRNKDVMDSIHYAKYIQGSMLPSQKTFNANFKENFIFYKPKDVVAGDFYWTETINRNQAIAVCDCTGHGVPGAMVSIVACNALNRAIKEFKLSNPAQIFDKVNELMQETFSKSDYEVNDGMDAVLCVIDDENKKLHIACANNPVWLVSPPSIKTNLWEQPWQLAQINPDKKPIGRHTENTNSFQLKSISFENSEMLYLFTDGFADQFGGPKGKKFKYKQLQDLFIKIAALPANEQKEQINETLTKWQGELEQVDDILIVGIRL